MIRTIVWVLALTAVPAYADGDCEFMGGGFHRADTSGACVAAAPVPAGCAIDFVIGHGAAAPAPFVNGVDATAQATLTFVATVDLTGLAVNIDDSDCACHPAPIDSAEDEYTIALSGLAAGDVVSLTSADGTESDPQDADLSTITISPAGPCPAPSWPTEIDAYSACDACPGAGSDSGSDTGSGSSSSPASGGCSTSSPSPGAAPLLLLLGVAALLRRRDT